MKKYYSRHQSKGLDSPDQTLHQLSTVCPLTGQCIQAGSGKILVVMEIQKGHIGHRRTLHVHKDVARMYCWERDKLVDKWAIREGCKNNWKLLEEE